MELKLKSGKVVDSDAIPEFQYKDALLIGLNKLDSEAKLESSAYIETCPTCGKRK